LGESNKLDSKRAAGKSKPAGSGSRKSKPDKAASDLDKVVANQETWDESESDILDSAAEKLDFIEKRLDADAKRPTKPLDVAALLTSSADPSLEALTLTLSDAITFGPLVDGGPAGADSLSPEARAAGVLIDAAKNSEQPQSAEFRTKIE